MYFLPRSQLVLIESANLEVALILIKARDEDKPNVEAT
jgi:hypothetical protein